MRGRKITVKELLTERVGELEQFLIDMPDLTPASKKFKELVKKTLTLNKYMLKNL